MELCIKDYKPQKIFTITEELIIDEWDKLAKEFPEIKSTYFHLIPWREYLKMFRDIHKGIPALDNTDTFVNCFLSNCPAADFMTTYVMGRGKSGEVIQYVYMLTERLMECLFLNMADYDTFVEACRTSLRHEVGHLVVNIGINNRHKNDTDGFFKEYLALANETRKKADELHKEYEDRIMDEAFFKRYHSLPLEKAANDMVGLTWKDHWDIEDKLLKACYGEERKRYYGKRNESANSETNE